MTIVIAGDFDIRLDLLTDDDAVQLTTLMASQACRVTRQTRVLGGLLVAVSTCFDLPVPNVDVTNVELSYYHLLSWSIASACQLPVDTASDPSLMEQGKHRRLAWRHSFVAAR
jgi:hypothetical protein